jgi:hypothetical protein
MAGCAAIGRVELPGMVDPPDAISPSLARPPRRGRKAIDGQAELLLPIAGELSQRPPKRPANRSIRPVKLEVTRTHYGRKR